MKTLTYNTTATKEVTFSRTETNTIEIAINGVKVGSTSTNNVAKETLSIMFGGRQFDLPMHDLDGNSVAAEFNDFAKNRVLHTFANLDERNEFIGEKESFGSVWWNEANEVCTYEYL